MMNKCVAQVNNGKRLFISGIFRFFSRYGAQRYTFEWVQTGGNDTFHSMSQNCIYFDKMAALREGIGKCDRFFLRFVKIVLAENADL